jgi:hypothetical protein
MTTIEEQKIKLIQKKARVSIEETKLKLKERKMRTRYLIEIGGLVVKAELDHLPTNILYGALLSLKNTLAENDSILKQWSSLGKTVLDKDEKSKVAIILKLDEMPSSETRTHLRTHGLRWNKLREEWYGYVSDVNSLKDGIASIKHEMEIIK